MASAVRWNACYHTDFRLIQAGAASMQPAGTSTAQPPKHPGDPTTPHLKHQPQAPTNYPNTPAAIGSFITGTHHTPVFCLPKPRASEHGAKRAGTPAPLQRFVRSCLLILCASVGQRQRYSFSQSFGSITFTEILASNQANRENAQQILGGQQQS